jgi:hypothetical protein
VGVSLSNLVFNEVNSQQHHYYTPSLWEHDKPFEIKQEHKVK